ncbi:MAG: radical SAM protein [Zoogloeaceae bacterium]|jgi:MoaA/NifB/PqqE/SkfB family radical SAM enzyme|nr:radical SAM protein [Zoogloeaceae bacterium]
MRPFLYLPLWFFKARILGKRIPLQSVVFISDKCNLKCKHCALYAQKEAISKTLEEVRADLLYCYRQGSRFVDFEGGEPTLWRDGEHDLNSLLRLARQIGFYTVTVTTNAARPFPGIEADSIWVSMDGVGASHEAIRGAGTFKRLIRHIETCGHPRISVNMVVNTLNHTALDETIDFARNHPNINSIAINLHTPFAGTEALELDAATRHAVLEKVIRYKKRGYPIMNSLAGLKRMQRRDFKKYCWMANFVMADGSRLAECNGKREGLCERCGFCMAGEMASVMSLAPETLLAGIKLRVTG